MAEMTTLQFDILAALTLTRRHGYALVEEVARMSNRRPAVATVYAALTKLQHAGFVEPDGDEIVDGRIRRYFQITQPGARALAIQANQMSVRAEAALTSLRRGEVIA
jgi:DNA-binding PadR family transcriptional regulator